MDNSRKVTCKHALTLIVALCLILGTVFLASMPVWASSKPSIRAYPNGRAELVDPSTGETIRAISKANKLAGAISETSGSTSAYDTDGVGTVPDVYTQFAQTPSPGEEEDLQSDVQITTPPVAPVLPPAEYSSTTTTAIKVVKLELYHVEGSIQIRKADETLHAGETYALKAIVETAQTVKNLRVELKVPKRLAGEEKTAAMLLVSYDKGGAHHVIGWWQNLTAENALTLSQEQSSCNTSPKLNGVHFSIEPSDTQQAYALWNRGLIKKGATADITVYIDAK